MWETIIINSFIGILSSAFKSKSAKEKYKAMLLQIRDSINTLYPDTTGVASLDDLKALTAAAQGHSED